MDPISAALVGSAVFTTGSGVAVGTTGLFGAAGAFGSGGLLTGALATYGGTALTAFSGLQAFAGGQQQAAAAKFSAVQQKIQTENTRIRAKEEANEARKRYLSTLSKLQAGYGARGIDISSGTPFAAQIDISGEATRDINAIKKTSDINVLQGYAQAKQYREAGKSYRTQGLLEGASKIGSVIAGAV